MPTFCRMQEGFLSRCIKSVQMQTFANFELIIVDDGSSDGSQDFITTVAAEDPRIVYVRHDGNSGLPAVRTNEGILLARADHVAFIFDDNIWEPDALEILWDAMRRTDVEVVHAKTRMQRGDGSHFLLGGWPLTVELLQHLNTIPNGAVLCSRTFFHEVGLYDPHLAVRRTCDWDLWLRGVELGARYHHVDRTLGVELGPSSPVSLGNSVPMDFKVVMAYMSDRSRLVERSRALRPDDISDYDVFDPSVLFGYFRNEAEWRTFHAEVYAPFFKRHSEFEPISAEPVGVVHESCGHGVSFNAAGTIFSPRKRGLVVCNRFTPLVAEWKLSLEMELDAIAVSCSEWQLSGFRPTDFDYLVLVDCAAGFIAPFVEAFRNQGTTIVYVVIDGLSPDGDDGVPSSLDLGRHPAILEVLNPGVYFPHFGRGWPDALRPCVRRLMELAHTVVACVEEQPDKAAFGAVPIRQLPFIAAGDAKTDGVQATVTALRSLPTLSAVYLGDVPAPPAPAWNDLAVRLDALCDTSSSGVTLFVIPSSTGLPFIHERWGSRAEIITTWDGLLTLAWQRPANYLVPDRLVRLLSRYERAFLTTELAAHGRHWRTLDGDEADAVGITHGVAPSAAAETRLARHADELRAAQISQRLSGGNGRVADTTFGIFVNSPLLSGSEAFGLMMGRLLRDLGFNILICTPHIHGYGAVDTTDIDDWLKRHDMAVSVPAAYGLGTRICNLWTPDIQEHGRNMARWLRERGVQVAIGSGFISDLLVMPEDEGIQVFLALFQPWGYPLDRMMFMRHRVAGVMSDCEWSAEAWRRWLPPPLRVVRTPLTDVDFGNAADDVPKTLRVAIGGTVQPRKRQLQAVEAVAALTDRGIPVTLNVYGYELPQLREYIDAVRTRIAELQNPATVVMHGLVSLHEIARDNDVILSASLDESMPQTVLYLMAAGLIAVACPAGGLPEVIVDGKTGYLCDGFSADAIASGLERAWGSRTEWPQIRQEATTLLQSRFHESRVRRELLDLILDGLALARTGRRETRPPGPAQDPPATQSDRPRGLKKIRRRLSRELRRVLGLSRKNPVRP